ncbi:hypothetical protein BDV97DRAFT_365783 [Delphinella strobiligena]|nr:hypothetical protein BDV97DRAFT_365783 [Delphinella strobiligena]
MYACVRPHATYATIGACVRIADALGKLKNYEQTDIPSAVGQSTAKTVGLILLEISGHLMPQDVLHGFQNSSAGSLVTRIYVVYWLATPMHWQRQSMDHLFALDMEAKKRTLHDRLDLCICVTRI